MAEKITVERIYKVSMGSKLRWEFNEKSVLEVDGEKFVKLPRGTHGFARMVFHGCQNLPDPLPPGYSLTASVGYQELTKLRAQLAAQEDADKELQDMPSLFKNKGEVPIARPKRQSRSNIKESDGSEYDDM